MTVPRRTTRRVFLARAASTLAVTLLGVVGAAGMAGCGTRGARETIGAPGGDGMADSGLVVDVGWLAQRLDDPAVRIIDCSPIRTFRSGHLRGAVHLWWQDTIEINNPVYGMLAGLETRQSLTRDAGIGPESTVVVYDDAGGVYASRVLWMLHSMGFSNGRLMDGGRQAWTTAGLPLTRDISERLPGAFEGSANEEVNAHAHDIESWLDREDIAILDTRTVAERSETWHGRLRLGSIPGSVWLPRDRFFGEPGSPFLAGRAVLIDRLRAAGIAPDTPEVVLYGLHSTLAAFPYVALGAVGTPHVRIYDGSWAEWGASERPLEPVT